jgi:hypothetical protein
MNRTQNAPTLRLAAVNGTILPEPTPAAVHAARTVNGLTDEQIARTMERLKSQSSQDWYDAARAKAVADARRWVANLDARISLLPVGDYRSRLIRERETLRLKIQRCDEPGDAA